MKKLFFILFSLVFVLSGCAADYPVETVGFDDALVEERILNTESYQPESLDTETQAAAVVSPDIIIPLAYFESELDGLNKLESEVRVIEDKSFHLDPVKLEAKEQIQENPIPAVLKILDQLEPKQETVKTKPADVPLSNGNTYVNVAGNEVHAPAYAPSVPVGASAVCRDNTYSFSQNRRGTCSRHGGVARWLN